MTRRILAISAVCAAGLAWFGVAQATTIDFETGAPPVFIDTTPLTTAYSVDGVIFSGVDGSGGSILDVSSSFGINAQSGRDFLAFNTFAGTGSIEKVSFSTPQSSFSIYVGDINPEVYTAIAFGRHGNVVGTATVSPAGGAYGELSIVAPGIRSVEFAGGTFFVADDMSFSGAAVPEPSLWITLISGCFGLGGVLRVRKKAQLLRTST
jgi:hypothetical protein